MYEILNIHEDAQVQVELSFLAADATLPFLRNLLPVFRDLFSYGSKVCSRGHRPIFKQEAAPCYCVSARSELNDSVIRGVFISYN